jgi:1-deoxy-D-xylulose-5-phosphate reductoisomerase
MAGSARILRFCSNRSGMKVISLLGSTGSIGTNTLRVTSSFPGFFRVAGLAGGQNTAVLADQVEANSPDIVSTATAGACVELQEILRRRNYPMARTRFVFGVEGNVEVACLPETSMVLSAITGAAGLVPTYRAIECGKHIALANKEAMVMAGSLMTSRARTNGVQIIPVDSEHNAIHQCLRGGRRDEVRRLILTASGGPFREATREKLLTVTLEEALNHPTWRMGKKITIDSATLMNKGLEVIEASWFFDARPEEIDVVIHPQSVIHSMVEFADGSILAQLGVTDMRIPIQYALTYPERWTSPMARLEVHKLAKLEFHEPDRGKFRCLDLAYQALIAGGTAPTSLNAANEIAVDAFLNRRIAFHEIPKIIEQVLHTIPVEEVSSLEAVLSVDARARHAAATLTNQKKQAEQS